MASYVAKLMLKYNTIQKHLCFGHKDFVSLCYSMACTEMCVSASWLQGVGLSKLLGGLQVADSTLMTITVWYWHISTILSARKLKNLISLIFSQEAVHLEFNMGLKYCSKLGLTAFGYPLSLNAAGKDRFSLWKNPNCSTITLGQCHRWWFPVWFPFWKSRNSWGCLCSRVNISGVNRKLLHIAGIVVGKEGYHFRQDLTVQCKIGFSDKISNSIASTRFQIAFTWCIFSVLVMLKTERKKEMIGMILKKLPLLRHVLLSTPLFWRRVSNGSMHPSRHEDIQWWW